MAYIDTSLKLEAFARGESRCLKLGELQVGLFHRPEGLYAIDNICPHRGAPLHDGMIDDGAVSCPWHQWQFQLSDGICRNIPKVRIATYPVEVREGAIWIDLPNPQPNKP
jgi:nitrite reductase (NADH) small subunit